MLRIVACVIISIIGWTASVRADDKELSVDQVMMLFLKVITYDQSFEFDDTKTVTVYLPYERSNAVSYEQYRAAQKFFNRNENLSVQGAQVLLVAFPVEHADSCLPKQSAADYSILIATSLGEGALKKLLESGSGTNLRTFSLNPEHVPLGVSVSVKAGEKKNAIVVNLAEAQREGSHFTAPLLKMCEIYKAPHKL